MLEVHHLSGRIVGCQEVWGVQPEEAAEQSSDFTVIRLKNVNFVKTFEVIIVYIFLSNATKNDCTTNMFDHCTLVKNSHSQILFSTCSSYMCPLEGS